MKRLISVIVALLLVTASCTTIIKIGCVGVLICSNNPPGEKEKGKK